MPEDLAPACRAPDPACATNCEATESDRATASVRIENLGKDPQRTAEPATNEGEEEEIAKREEKTATLHSSLSELQVRVGTERQENDSPKPATHVSRPFDCTTFRPLRAKRLRRLCAAAALFPTKSITHTT
jgi:hypothetical protein